jgi:acyl-CoA thioester hydrolase
VTPRQSVSRIRVRYADTDKMGIAYYANYFIWFEVGRTDLLRATGWSYREMEGEGLSLPVVEAQCAYCAPARYDDEIEVRTSAVLMSPVRVKFTYEIVRVDDLMMLATGATVHAALNRNGRPSRLPERVRALLS